MDDNATRRGRRDDPPEPLRHGIDELFRADGEVLDAVTTNLGKRGVASRAAVERAHNAFDGFNASRHPAETRERSTYLAPGDDLYLAMEANATRTVADSREAPAAAGLRLAMTDGLRSMVTPDDSDQTLGTVSLAALVDHIARTAGDGFGRGGLTTTPCAAETAAERLLATIEGSLSAPAPTDDARPPVAPSNHPVNAVVDTDGAEPDDAGAVLVEHQVARQTALTTAPEGELLFSVPQRSDQETRNKAVATFELRDGPSDVTSYHDFTSLQIAFPHVWTEVFDGRLRALGEELYQEYVRLQEFAGADPDDRGISTLADLSRLMADIEELSRVVQNDLPTDLRQPTDGGAPAADAAGSVEIKDVVRTALDPASVLTDGIKDDTVRAFLNPGGYVMDSLTALFAGKQQLSWASFPGPLPIGGDIITVAFEEGVVEPGTVEIVLRSSPEVSWWKGIHFRELDTTNALVNEFKISNDPGDTDVWSAEAYNRLPLYTPQISRAVLEFSKAAMLGFRTGFYLLSDLSHKLKDRGRVTFTWVKD
jgi:hypothetical protein